MSLATRCTSCGTVFRVVQDQLKVSEGWVRCGRCDAVFNAADGLFNLEHESPPPWSPTQPPTPATSDAEAARPAADDSPRQIDVRPSAASVASFDDDDLAAFGMSRPPGPAPAPAPAISPPLASPATASPRPTVGSDAATAGRGFEAPSADVAGSLAPNAAADAQAPPSRFAERAHREAFGQRKRTGTWLWAAALVLLAGALAAQAAGQFSELAAARWPAAQPLLARWCALTGCSTAAPRHIEDVVVDSSALAPVIGTDALKLGIALRNRASFEVAVPSIDLSLTDSTGQLIARRTLGPSDFQVTATSLKPGSELPLQAIITAGTATVTGYTVEVFYP